MIDLRRPLLAHSLRFEWLGTVAAVCAFAALAAWQGWFSRLDQTLYDLAVATLARPAPAEVVILAVDEESLERVGRWPWRRGIHATALDRLTQAGVRGVAFDVIFAEPDAADPAGDAAFAAALRRSGRAVLPVLMDAAPGGAVRQILPIPAFLEAATLGHVHLELDRDGIARSVFLREGRGEAKHSQLALALAEAARAAPAALPGERRPAGPVASGAWVRDHRVHIAYLGPPGTVRRISYARFLAGEVSAAEFEGRMVFVGATAAGMLDAYPTPVSGEGRAMPGVEVSANVLAGLIEGRFVRIVPAWLQIALAVIACWTLLTAFLRLSARRALLVTVGAALAVSAGTLALMILAGWWFAPSAAIAGLLSCYPVWSWRRLEATQRFIDAELEAAENAPYALALPERRKTDRSGALSDALERRIARARSASARARDLHRFVADTLDSLPEAAMVIDRSQRVTLANARAAQLPGAGEQGVLGRRYEEVLAPALAEKRDELPALFESAPSGFEARGSDGRDLLVRAEPFADSSGRRSGLLLTLVDVSALKAAERKREEYMRFLSHDLRSPLVSITAMLDLHDLAPQSSPPDLLSRIRRSVERSFALADDFLQLGRADSLDPARFSDVDLAALLTAAVEEEEARAAGKRITVAMGEGVTQAPARGVADVLLRVFVNLISNAVKYSPEGTRVECSVQRAGEFWRCTVADQGYGISAEDLPRLFGRFERLDAARKRGEGGAGLGLAFVKTAVERHGGRMHVTSEPGKGSQFSVELPAA